MLEEGTVVAGGVIVVVRGSYKDSMTVTIASKTRHLHPNEMEIIEHKHVPVSFTGKA